MEWFLAGVLEQLAAPPREEDVDGEALFLWGWPAVGAAGSFLAFMVLLLLFAQTVPYAAFHVTNGVVETAHPMAMHRSRGQQQDGRPRSFWSRPSLLFRDAPPSPPPSSSRPRSSASPGIPTRSPEMPSPSPEMVPFPLTPKRRVPDWSSVLRPSPAADAALVFVDARYYRESLARTPLVSSKKESAVGGGRDGRESANKETTEPIVAGYPLAVIPPAAAATSSRCR
ncbi:unnamed protein product, partial [Scytosiphon promiscuus]